MVIEDREVEEEEGWDAFEVSRSGDDIFLTFSRVNGDAYALHFTPEDAQAAGLALIQAGFTPEENEQ